MPKLSPWNSPFAVLGLITATLTVVGCDDGDATVTPKAQPDSSHQFGKANRAPARGASPIAAVAPSGTVTLDDAGLSVVDVPAPREISVRDRESIAHEKDDTTDYLALAQSLTDDGKPAEAITALRHALFDADDASVWAALGLAAAHIDDDATAAVALTEALARDPSLVEARRTMAQIRLKEGNIDAARRHADVLVARAPTNVQAQYLSGKIYMKATMWAEALAAFSSALEGDPGNAFTHNNIGYSALMIGQNDVAIRHLEDCLSLGPVRPFMLNNLGVAYERDGRRVEALAAYMRAAEMKPGYTNAVINQDRLKDDLGQDDIALAEDLLDEMRRVPPGSTMAAVEQPYID